VLRAILGRLPEARYVAHYVKCSEIGKRDMCREIARVAQRPAGQLLSRTAA